MLKEIRTLAEIIIPYLKEDYCKAMIVGQLKSFKSDGSLYTVQLAIVSDQGEIYNYLMYLFHEETCISCHSVYTCASILFQSLLLLIPALVSTVYTTCNVAWPRERDQIYYIHMYVYIHTQFWCHYYSKTWLGAVLLYV